MKIFWIMLAALAVAAAALLAMPHGGTSAPTPVVQPPAVIAPTAPVPAKPSTASPAAPATPAPPAKPAAPAVNEPVAKPAPAAPPVPDPEPAPESSDPLASLVEQSLGPTGTNDKPAAAPAHSPAPASNPPAPAATKPAPATGGSPAPAPSNAPAPAPVSKPTLAPTPPPPATTSTPPKAVADSTPPSPAAATATAPAAASPAKIVQREDGSMLVDDRYVIKGKGTKDEPYQIPWDFLVSAEEVYKPRLGQKNLPDRLSIVKDKYVKITGYVAFPIMAQEPDEMLAMLNQWDGCCIGVPPTPYDAIEVKLQKAASKEDRFATYGAVTGKLGVEPYLVKDWLIGLYTMDDAVLKAEK